MVETAEVLHMGFLKSLLVSRKATANEFVLAELGRFPLQTLELVKGACDLALHTI